MLSAGERPTACPTADLRRGRLAVVLVSAGSPEMVALSAARVRLGAGLLPGEATGNLASLPPDRLHLPAPIACTC